MNIEPSEKRKGIQLPAELDLRDYFAAKAMQGFLACNRFNPFANEGAEIAGELLAANAYEVADAMLAARDGKAGA